MALVWPLPMLELLRNKCERRASGGGCVSVLNLPHFASIQF